MARRPQAGHQAPKSVSSSPRPFPEGTSIPMSPGEQSHFTADARDRAGLLVAVNLSNTTLGLGPGTPGAPGHPAHRQRPERQGQEVPCTSEMWHLGNHGRRPSNRITDSSGDGVHVPHQNLPLHLLHNRNRSGTKRYRSTGMNSPRLSMWFLQAAVCDCRRLLSTADPCPVAWMGHLGSFQFGVVTHIAAGVPGWLSRLSIRLRPGSRAHGP